MNSRKIRTLIPVAVLLVAGIAYAVHLGIGNLSAIGWSDVAVICPVGALGTMLATKTAVPHAIVSLVLAIVGIAIVGRAFCAWVCPVPVVSKVRGLFAKREHAKDGGAPAGEGDEAVVSAAVGVEPVAAAASDAAATPAAPAPLSERERSLLSRACGKNAGCGAPSPTRHFVLGGALLSTAVFGFPVFCLICPVGLTFAGVFVLISLFAHGDVTWSVLAIPAVLLVEVVFFRKWCSHVCPIGSFMSLVSRLNRTFRPEIDHAKCLVDSRGVECGRCAAACEVGIDPRDPLNGAPLHECTKCRACVEACPVGAVSMPLVARVQANAAAVRKNEAGGD